KFSFEAAQTLPSAPANHKCRKMHGHSFTIEISVEGPVDPETGWVFDHAEISRATQPLIDLLDHSYMNEIPGLENPTLKIWRGGFGTRLLLNVAGYVRLLFMKRRARVALIVDSRNSVT